MLRLVAPVLSLFLTWNPLHLTDPSHLSDLTWSGVDVGTISPAVFEMAMGAAACAARAGAVTDAATLTVIDYSRPSTQKRLWVYDLRHPALLFEEHVSHGSGSGHDIPTKFSNVPGSHQTSLGLFVTAETYTGANGYSMRLDGLEAGVNDRARERAIVMHGAPYVNPVAALAQGRLGRSQGCPALRPAVARNVINTVKGGSLLFAYAEDADWLRSSAFLGDCAAAHTN